MRPPQSLFAFLLVLVTVSAGVVAADGATAIDHQGEEIVLDAAGGQHVAGTTPFDPGTVIGVRIKSVGDTHPFLVSKAVRVNQNGSFDVAFDLSELAPLRGGPIAVSVRHNETTIHQISGVIVTKNMPDESTLTYDSSTPATTSEATSTAATTTSTSTPTGPLSGVTVPGLGIIAALVSLLAVGALARP
ncbi:BGTF surface domain-containing protein [Haloferax sp. YSMS24]|uniref:BGTF surface domain-containing protein n=1 Tax=unclassified Haloferax TaxID=2625095 RepID=UPI00398CF60D